MNLLPYAHRGVIAAVWRDLHSLRVPPPEGLDGRVIVLDVTIPTSSARGCVIAVYAPWDPGGSQPTPRQFWSMLTPLCQDAPSRAWCVIGDCNLTLDSIETSASHAQLSPNRLSCCILTSSATPTVTISGSPMTTGLPRHPLHILSWQFPLHSRPCRSLSLRHPSRYWLC